MFTEIMMPEKLFKIELDFLYLHIRKYKCERR